MDLKADKHVPITFLYGECGAHPSLIVRAYKCTMLNLITPDCQVLLALSNTLDQSFMLYLLELEDTLPNPIMWYLIYHQYQGSCCGVDGQVKYSLFANAKRSTATALPGLTVMGRGQHLGLRIKTSKHPSKLVDGCKALQENTSNAATRKKVEVAELFQNSLVTSCSEQVFKALLQFGQGPITIKELDLK